MSNDYRRVVAAWLQELGHLDVAAQVDDEILLVPSLAGFAPITLVHPTQRPEHIDLYADLGALSPDASSVLLRRLLALNTLPELAEGAVGVAPDTNTLYLRTSQAIDGLDALALRTVATNLARLAAELQENLVGWAKESPASHLMVQPEFHAFDQRV